MLFRSVSQSRYRGAESKQAYGDTRIREIFCRWLNNGNDQLISILSIRLLNRLNLAPKTYRIVVDAKDRTIGLADVVNVTSRVISDDTGAPLSSNLQVIKLMEAKYGHEVEITAQAYNYQGRTPRVMASGSPDYGSATSDQIAKGCFIVDAATLTFADGTGPYQMI